jgi:hypothetical protein
MATRQTEMPKTLVHSPNIQIVETSSLGTMTNESQNNGLGSCSIAISMI